MQEDQGLLAEHNEYRVAQLRQLAEHEQPGPEAAHAILFDVAGGLEKGENINIGQWSEIKFPASQFSDLELSLDWTGLDLWEGGVHQPGHADGVEESVVTQHVQQFRGSAGGSHDAEHGQHCVPYDQRTAKLKSVIEMEDF